jgi:SAM-dependent methyltransferase
MENQDVAAQYKTEENLRIRIETHQRYTMGPPLEPAIDAAIALKPDESLLDIRRAIEEARRVLKPGGRFLAVTNTRDNFGEYRRALSEAAALLTGNAADAFKVGGVPSDLFNEENGSSFIQDVFGKVTATFVRGSLRFESAEPVLRYFDSGRNFKSFTEEEWDMAQQAFAKVIAGRFAPGTWVVSKTSALLSAHA